MVTVPKLVLYLIGNTLTQYICISAVFILTTECASLTVTLVITLRKVSTTSFVTVSNNITFIMILVVTNSNLYNSFFSSRLFYFQSGTSTTHLLPIIGLELHWCLPELLYSH